MKYFLLLGLILPFSFHVSAQQEQTESSIRDVFKTKRHWELGLNHGFVRPTISPDFGPEKAYAINGRVFDLSLGYTFNASEKLGFTASGKAGAFPMIVGIPPTDYSSGQDTKQYFHYVDYTVFAELAATAAYRHFLNPRVALVSGAGLGAKFLAPSSLGVGFSTFNSNSRSRYTLKNTNEANPFLLLQTTLHYKIKNSDLLGFRLSYQHSLKPVLEGTYYIASNSPDYSYGKVEVKGHQLTLGLLYTFTGYEKLKRRIAEETPNNKRELKKTMKREYYEKRVQKSSAIRVYGAVFADQNISTDHFNVIGNYRPTSLGYGLDFQRAFKPAYFWEAGFNYHEYWHGNTYNYPGLTVGRASLSDAFPAMQLSAGSGYILRNKNLVPLFYFSGGAAIGFSNDNYTGLVGHSGNKKPSVSAPEFLEMYSDNYQLRNVFPLLYAGLRKDFRIRGKLFFSPAFRYNKGLTKIYERRIQYTTNQIFPEIRQTTSFMRGSYFQYSIGLKLDL